MTTYVEQLQQLMARGNVTAADLAVESPPAWATDVKLMVEGLQFYPVIGNAIAQAQHSIHIIQFGFKSGEVGFGIAKVLADKAQAGVKVRLIVDRLGSAFRLKLVRRMYDDLVKAGVEVVVNDPMSPFPKQGAMGSAQSRHANWSGLAKMDHRKLFIIDGQVAFMGGAGIEDHFFNGQFHDVFMGFRGEVVHQLQLLFLTSYLVHGGPLPQDAAGLEPLFPPVAPADVRYAARVLHNVPTARFHPATAAALAQIEQAQRTLDIMNPYVTDHRILNGLIAAAQRGVAVRMIVPGKPNNKACDGAMRHYYKRMLAAGIKIWEYPAVVHAKVLVRDGEVVHVGTLNYDALSLRNNAELMLELQGAALANMVSTDLFEGDIPRCRPGAPTANLLARAWGAGMSALSPVL